MEIGLIGNVLNPIKKDGLITGYAMATDTLIQSIIKYSSAEKIYCTYEPRQYQIERLKEFANEKCIFLSEYDLLFYGLDKLSTVDILHSVKEDALPLLYLRESIKKHIPITFTLHGIAEQHLIVDFFYYMLYMPFREYDAIICTSDAVYTSVEKIFQRLSQTLNCPKRKIRLEKAALGVDTDYFCPMNKIECRKKNGIDEDAFVILWLGRFSDIFKADLHPLLHTFKKLLDSNTNKKLLLLLVGGEEKGNGYSNMLKNDIAALGIEANTRIMFNHEISDRAEIYNTADVFTSPVDNIQETFGLTPVEAMSCGIPQVISDWDGYRETVDNGSTGFLVDVLWNDCMEDVAKSDFLPFNIHNRKLLHKILSVRSTAVDCEKYYEKLNLLINNNLLLKRMGEESRKRAIEKFSLKCNVESTEKIWNRLLDIAEKTDGVFLDQIPRVDYCNDFKSYPTRFVNDEDKFKLTEFGKRGDYYKLPSHPYFTENIDEGKLPIEILDYMKSNEMTSIDELKNIFVDYTAHQIRRSVMFLFKYDLIAFLR